VHAISAINVQPNLLNILRQSYDNLTDYVSSCGISLTPAVYQVVGFGSSRAQRSVISEE